MTNRGRAFSALLLVVAGPLVAAVPVAAQEPGAADLHAAWRGCLQRNFGLQLVLTSRTLAAESALRACRASEISYLSALSSSPLVDDEDVARVRPALVQRAKGWLLGRSGATRPL